MKVELLEDGDVVVMTMPRREAHELYQALWDSRSKVTPRTLNGFQRDLGATIDP